MYIVIVDGDLGAGKTLFSTLYAQNVVARSNAVLFSNYEQKNAIPFTSYRDFLIVAEQPSSIITFDEAHTSFDSRFFARSGQIYMTQLLYYLRKLRCTIILTSPRFTNIDSRVRDLCNIYVYAYKDDAFFYYQIFDWQGKRLLKELRIRKSKAINLARRLYDTDTLVVPVEFPTKEDVFKLFLAELQEKRENYNPWLKEKTVATS